MQDEAGENLDVQVQGTFQFEMPDEVGENKHVKVGDTLQFEMPDEVGENKHVKVGDTLQFEMPDEVGVQVEDTLQIRVEMWDEPVENNGVQAEDEEEMQDELTQHNVLAGNQDEGKFNLEDALKAHSSDLNVTSPSVQIKTSEEADQYFKKGNLLEKKGELGEAAFSYQEALMLKPGWKLAEERLKSVLQKKDILRDLTCIICDQFHMKCVDEGKRTFDVRDCISWSLRSDLLKHLFKSCLAYFSQKTKYDCSSSSISEISKTYPLLYEAALRKASEYRKSGNHESAKLTYEIHESLCNELNLDISGNTFVQVHENQQACKWDKKMVEKLEEITELELLICKKPTAAPHPVSTYLPFSPDLSKRVAESNANFVEADAESILNTPTNEGLHHEKHDVFGKQEQGLPGLKGSRLTSKIKVCYVSSDFKDHSLCHLIAGVFYCHNRSVFEVTLIALNPDDGSEFRKRVEKDADKFYNVSNRISDINMIKGLVNEIKSSRYNILVNLNGYTRGSMNELFAFKLAKVQVMWMGFPGTSGSDYMDYIISDITTTPKGSENHFSERIARLPGSHFVGDHARLFQCVEEKIVLNVLESTDFIDTNAVINADDLVCARQIYERKKVTVVCSPVNDVPGSENDVVVYEVIDHVDWSKIVEQLAQSEIIVTHRQQFGLPWNKIVFCNFCQSYKYDERTLLMWIEILRAVPESVLWLLTWVTDAQENIMLFFTQSNIAKERIIFTPTLKEKKKYIISLQLADIFLDTPLVNGHTTCLDALWAGTPVVTLPGVKMASRIAASLVKTIGCAQLIANNEKEYTQIAINYGTNRKLLQSVRARIYKNRINCSLFNTDIFTKNLEILYFWMLLQKSSVSNSEESQEEFAEYFKNKMCKGKQIGSVASHSDSGQVSVSESGQVKVQTLDPVKVPESDLVRLLKSSTISVSESGQVGMLVPDPMSCHVRVLDSGLVSVPESGSVIVPGSFQVNFVCFIQGSFHQGDVQFPKSSRGRQCAANAICALLYVRYKQLFSKEDLDNVLKDGDRIYRDIKADLKLKRLLECDLLSFEDMPSHIQLFSSRYQVDKHDIISGYAVKESPEQPLLSLHSSLESALRSVPNVLVLFGLVCSAVFMKDNLYWFFDSHAHGLDGLSTCSSIGKSVLMSFAKFDDLMSYLYSFYLSMKIELRSQFDILPVEFSEVPLQHTYHPASN